MAFDTAPQKEVASPAVTQRQALFDRGATFLLKRAEEIENGLTRECLYRGEQGTPCVIGDMITDEFYNEDFEGVEFDGGNYDLIAAVEGSLKIKLDKHDIRLLCEFQGIHDDFDVQYWHSELREVAREFDLQCNF